MTALDEPVSDAEPLQLAHLARCFTGGIPAVLATASVEGIPNVTYLSRAHQVDEERIALSNQFMSKTARNLAGNPLASLLLMDPVSHDEFRLLVRYERTERRGPLFERLRADVDALAAQIGMQDVFRLRAADIFRVIEIDRIPSHPSAGLGEPAPAARDVPPALAGLAELARRLDRASDLDIVVDLALEGLDRLLGYRHAALLLLDEEGRRLYTIASRGYHDEHVGAEVLVGEGQIGAAAARCELQSMTGLRQYAKYSRTIRHAYEQRGVHPGRELAVPGLPDVDSRIVVPVKALGQLVGVVVVESGEIGAFDRLDEEVLQVACAMLGNAVEHARALAVEPDGATAASRSAPSVGPPPSTREAHVRFFAADGSTFIDGRYVIKGVAGRILWSLVSQHVEEGRTEFTNRELRLDRSLALPGFKDNLESRLILLKRRLDEHEAPVRIEKTGRGRFRLGVSTALRLESVEEGTAPR